MKSISASQIASIFAREGLSFSKFIINMEGAFHPSDAIWNYMDTPHAEFVHGQLFEPIASFDLKNQETQIAETRHLLLRLTSGNIFIEKNKKFCEFSSKKPYTGTILIVIFQLGTSIVSPSVEILSMW